MPFALSDSVVEQLRAVQARRAHTDDVIEQNDAFLLDPGLGPALYLTSDGRVLVDYREWNGSPVREATPEEAIIALVIGARKTGVAELLSLLPPPPADAQTCPICQGTHYAGEQKWMCPKCSGRGWLE